MDNRSWKVIAGRLKSKDNASIGMFGYRDVAVVVRGCSRMTVGHRRL